MPGARESCGPRGACLFSRFLLRPGFGAAADNFSHRQPRRLRDHGLYFSGKRIKCQEYILGGAWRVASRGNVRSKILTRARQNPITAQEPSTRTHSASRITGTHS